jgi:LPS export ABC transporter protein LptC|tara:strand:- start:364 stop:948 length:585 start_codon:yes stop_codon:yes gene_type:complete
MDKKTIVQVLMVFLITIISLSFYLKYFNKTPKNIEKNITKKSINNEQNNSSTFIDNINYISSDVRGNRYQITAEQAEIDINNSNEMFLKNVVAYIFIKDSDTIKIIADFGKYNSKNYDTIFSKNVMVIYPENKITGDYLDFSFLNSLGTISTNVIYAGDKTNLFADKIEIDLITKDTKIFMNDNTKKILVKGNK